MSDIWCAKTKGINVKTAIQVNPNVSEGKVSPLVLTLLFKSYRQTMLKTELCNSQVKLLWKAPNPLRHKSVVQFVCACTCICLHVISSAQGLSLGVMHNEDTDICVGLWVYRNIGNMTKLASKLQMSKIAINIKALPVLISHFFQANLKPLIKDRLLKILLVMGRFDKVGFKDAWKDQ